MIFLRVEYQAFTGSKVETQGSTPTHTRKEASMYMAIAVQVPGHLSERENYRVWFLKFDEAGKLVHIGAKSREELIQSLFENYRKYGKSNWRAFCKDSEHSTPIEPYDFINLNMYENTHFGTLPTLAEFQATLNTLQEGIDLHQLAAG